MRAAPRLLASCGLALIVGTAAPVAAASLGPPSPGIRSSALSATADGVVSGRLLMSPIAITLQLSPSIAKVGQTVKARATITNLGAVTLLNIAVRLRIDPTGIAIGGSAGQAVAALAPGRRATVSWSLCGREPGSYLALVEASVDGVVVVSSARLLQIVLARNASC